MKKYIIIIILSVAAIIILTIAITVFTNPLRGTEEQIRERVLRLTPVGTSMEEVLQVIDDNRRWEPGISHPRGIPWYIVRHTIPGFPFDGSIGSQSISVYVRTHRFFIIPNWVEMFWGFDEDGYLIDVRIRKYLAI